MDGGSPMQDLPDEIAAVPICPITQVADGLADFALELVHTLERGDSGGRVKVKCEAGPPRSLTNVKAMQETRFLSDQTGIGPDVG